MIEAGKRNAGIAGSLPGNPDGKGFPLLPDGLGRHVPLSSGTMLRIPPVGLHGSGQISDSLILPRRLLLGLTELFCQGGDPPALRMLLLTHGRDGALSAISFFPGRDLGSTNSIAVCLPTGAQPSDSALLPGKLAVEFGHLCKVL